MTPHESTVLLTDAHVFAHFPRRAQPGGSCATFGGRFALLRLGGYELVDTFGGTTRPLKCDFRSLAAGVDGFRGPARFKLPLVHLVGRAHVVAALRNEPNDLLLVAVLRWSEAAGVFVVDNVVRLPAEIHVYDAFVADGGRPEALGLAGSDFFGRFNVLTRLRLHATAGGCPRLELLETTRFPRMLFALALDGDSLFGFPFPPDGRFRAGGELVEFSLRSAECSARPTGSEEGALDFGNADRLRSLWVGGVFVVAADRRLFAFSRADGRWRRTPFELRSRAVFLGTDGGVLIAQDEEGFFYRFPITSPDSLRNSCWTTVSRLSGGHSKALSADSSFDCSN
ncbi:hypothetical protein M3Y99_01535600 [Aphelenchoides fujianensis]|nr:hypothetical protein M3Y99_01535600 [Aphelenchoides fujianensis]